MPGAFQTAPLHLRNAPTKLMKDIGYGKDYKYAHGYEGNFVQDSFMPEELDGKQFYEPGKNMREDELRKGLKQKWEGRKRY